jgi:outer membrane protein assembly factor BamB
MSTPPSETSIARTPLRLWPGVVIVIAQWLLRFVLPSIAPDAEVFGLPLALIGILGGVGGGVALVVWWVFFSRAPWSERLGAIALMILAVVATRAFVDVSIANAGMGMLLYVLTVPVLCLALVVWAVAARRLAVGTRRVALVVAIVLASVPWTLIRTAGVSGAGSEFHWRWTETPEQRLLARGGDDSLDSAREKSQEKAQDTSRDTPAVPASPPSAPAAVEPAKTSAATPHGTPAAAASNAAATKSESPAPVAMDTPAEWPGFRGPERDGLIRGVKIETDWAASPPVRMWSRPIGPGWSSFAVRGDLLYTQEQRGAEEIVSAHRVSTGAPVWKHRDPVRFWESNGGAGPRATPTIDKGRVYTFGATGILNALNAATGKVVWSRNAASDTGRRIPDWGFASSPLVIDDEVVVAVSGTLAAYDVATGKPRWVGPSHGGSYSSPHRTTIDGVPQILLLTGAGATSVAEADGKLLWEYAWPGSVIVQPALTSEGDILINSIAATGGLGTRRLAVAHGAGGWNVEERWTSNGLKPYFNDFVVHKGHAFGFDGNILACIDLEDGKRKWKGGRYGNGQLVLLPDQDVLVVLSEEGELALVKATPDQFVELARVPALEGKTWNHPVLVRDVLLVRNGQEMAAFRVTLATR